MNGFLVKVQMKELKKKRPKINFKNVLLQNIKKKSIKKVIFNVCMLRQIEINIFGMITR